jgi:hypothetical protein
MEERIAAALETNMTLTKLTSSLWGLAQLDLPLNRWYPWVEKKLVTSCWRVNCVLTFQLPVVIPQPAFFVRARDSRDQLSFDAPLIICSKWLKTHSWFSILPWTWHVPKWTWPQFFTIWNPRNWSIPMENCGMVLPWLLGAVLHPHRADLWCRSEVLWSFQWRSCSPQKGCYHWPPSTPPKTINIDKDKHSVSWVWVSQVSELGEKIFRTPMILVAKPWYPVGYPWTQLAFGPPKRGLRENSTRKSFNTPAHRYVICIYLIIHTYIHTHTHIYIYNV